jgi:anti-sigma B factor antagonist
MIDSPEPVTSSPAPSEPDDVSPFRCETSFVDEHAILTVRGELDLATAPTLEREAMAALALPLEGLVLDFGGVTFLDSSGIAVLVTTRRAAVERGVTFALAEVSRTGRQTLELSGLSELFDLDG